MRRGVVRVIDDIALIDAVAWNALVDAQPSATPFVRHEYLLALQASGSACDETGWSTRFVCIFDDADVRGDDADIPARPGARLLAACPLYLKAHSYGEYVFDWAWAEAYRRHGLRYYPKMLGAVPFTPVAGTRLLATDDAWRDRLVEAVQAQAFEAGLSSVHVIFTDEADTAALARAGWMLRHGVQFHWQAEADTAPCDFTVFLATLQREKRKKITQERRRVSEQGIRFSTHEGSGITESLWDFFHRCYTLTYQAHHSSPYLTRAFFAAMLQTMAANWVLFVARRGEEPIGCSLIAVDPERRVAYGRYWGATEFVPCLHFEACYYQPLAWCMSHGYRRFEGGAQGEHKMARGLLPVRTSSAHLLRDPRFASAVADFLGAEGTHVDSYVDELRERNPFKASSAST